ncbi:hypothetical protein ILUMI_02737 [Ignelater luminosus]|uniref:Uncharacterized protein n=1 Tax=Ignelater luminosus TaxID=2038154 RepID=A0A8K0GKK5_IGNLU|nr:hypothetical protein ILUMI_02737 [Ignelater luminosus]
MKTIIFTVLLLAITAYADEIPIVKYSNEGVNPDGSYQWSYETGNGIAAEEQGAPKSPEILAAHGAYHFKTPEGVDVAIQYVADENGFQPQGNSIPVPPPIPEAILRGLAWNQAHPEQDKL